ncbi:MAG: lysophospholipase [Nitrospirota bacterium]|nr:lysophospholipase [Nitrospirota bacterium]MDH5587195.1 lysophospholipase [Nitrospirota bacterium]MDH5773393.1 lysophospholipase [Nitrospirota bacterium]
MDTALPKSDERIIETSVAFSNASSLFTPAIFAEPSTPTHRCVILCHGFLSDKQSRTNRRLTELLVPQGIATVRFDWYGMGESRQHFPNMTLKHCQDQLDTVFQMVQERELTHLGLVGSSFGGLLAILAAPHQPTLQALGLKCPVVDFPEVLRMEFGPDAMARWKSTNHIPNIIGNGSPVPLHYGFYEECLTYDAYAALSHIQVPTLVVHGDQDELIPRPQIDRLLTTLTASKQLTLISGADHQFGRPEDFRLMTTHLAQWMINHLTNP